MPWMNSTIRAISVFFLPIPFSIPSQSTIFSGSQRKVVLRYFITEIVHCNTISWDIIIHSFIQRTNPKTQSVFVNCVLQCLQYFLSPSSICLPQITSNDFRLCLCCFQGIIAKSILLLQEGEFPLFVQGTWISQWKP